MEQKDPGDCLRECLTKWLNGEAETVAASVAQRHCEPRSWRTIVNALKAQSVNRQSLANEIEKNYCSSREEPQPHHGRQSHQDQSSLSRVPEQLQVLPCKTTLFFNDGRVKINACTWGWRRSLHMITCGISFQF